VVGKFWKIYNWSRQWLWNKIH